MGTEREVFQEEVESIPEVNNADNVTSLVAPFGGVNLEIWLKRGGFISMKYYANE